MDKIKLLIILDLREGAGNTGKEEDEARLLLDCLHLIKKTKQEK